MNSKRSRSLFGLFRSRSSSRRRGTPDMSVRVAAIERLVATSRYLTDGVELYHFLGAIVTGACDMVGMENCRSLELVLAPAADLRAGKLWAVAPTATGIPAFASA